MPVKIYLKRESVTGYGKKYRAPELRFPDQTAKKGEKWTGESSAEGWTRGKKTQGENA